MKSDWKTVRLGDVAKINPSLALKKGTVAKKVSMDKITPHCRDIVSYSEEAYSGGAKFVNGCTLMARITPCLENGKISQVRFLDKKEVAFGSTEFIVFDGLEGITDRDFVYYLVNTELVRQKAIDSMVGSSGRQRAQSDEVANIEFPLPPLPTQCKIAAVLGSIDDKIENNRKICANLEAQAQALFKSWFVDFEPFGGKMPKGWKMEFLQECINFQEGPGIRNWQYVEKEGTRFINIRCIVDHDIKIATANMISNEEASGKYAHFMLNEYDIVMSCSGTLGRFAIVRKCHLPLCLNTSVIRFYPKGSFDHFSWLYGYLGSDDFLLQQEALANGSVQANFGPTHLKGMKVRMPSDDALARYHNIVFPLIKKELSLLDESRALAELRDALLPKLMSGEIDVDKVDV